MKIFTHDWSIKKTADFDSLPRWFDAFLLDRKAQRMSTGTIDFYIWKLKLIDEFLHSRNVTTINQITSELIREMLVDLERSHNPGGVHQVYRVMRTFLNWYEAEAEPPNWRNPLSNIKPPRLNEQPLAPIETATLKKLLATCDDSFHGIRDRAIMLLLLDTGIRAGELVALDRDDIDEVTGDVQVRNGKGGKPRLVMIGKRTRKAMRLYLKLLKSDDALFVTEDGNRISYRRVDNILRERAKLAGVEKPTLHSFRRAFALNSLRNGMDVFSLQRLMGHADLQVMRRYLAQTDDDIRISHAKASPVDNW